MKIFAKPTKKEMMLILFLGIVLTVFYYKGLFKEIFIEGSDSSACETLIKEIGVKSFQKVGEEQCTWGRTILKYNLVDEDNDKYGVYCLSSTFSAVTMPKAIATVTCSNYNKIADKADNMNGAELLVGALGSMLSDGKTAYFLTEEEIKAREEDEREKRLIALAADDMGFNEGTIHKCEDIFFIVRPIEGENLLIVWDKENRNLYYLDPDEYVELAVDPNFDIDRCSQNGSKTLQKIIERHRKIKGVKQGNGVFRKLMSKGVGFLIYYESQCNIDGKSLYVKEDKNYILGLNQIDMIQYTFFLSDEKDIEKNAENQEFQLITNASDDEEEPKFQLDIKNLTCEEAQKLFYSKNCEYDNQGKIKCEQ